MMIVRSPYWIPTVVYVVWRASPVMIPGSAIGRITSRVIVSRPKKENRAIASERSVPKTIASAVAPSAACTESRSASRTPGSFHATLNHLVEKSSIGHRWVMLSLNAYTATRMSGR